MRLKDFKGGAFYALSSFMEYRFISVFTRSDNGKYYLTSKIDTHTDKTLVCTRGYHSKDNEYLIINKFYEGKTSVYDNIERAKADVLKYSLKHYQEKLIRTEKQLNEIKDILSNLEKAKEKYIQIFPEKLL